MRSCFPRHTQAMDHLALHRDTKPGGYSIPAILINICIHIYEITTRDLHVHTAIHCHVGIHSHSHIHRLMLTHIWPHPQPLFHTHQHKHTQEGTCHHLGWYP